MEDLQTGRSCFLEDIVEVPYAISKGGYSDVGCCVFFFWTGRDATWILAQKIWPRLGVQSWPMVSCTILSNTQSRAVVRFLAMCKWHATSSAYSKQLGCFMQGDKVNHRCFIFICSTADGEGLSLLPSYLTSLTSGNVGSQREERGFRWLGPVTILTSILKVWLDTQHLEKCHPRPIQESLFQGLAHQFTLLGDNTLCVISDQLSVQ